MIASPAALIATSPAYLAAAQSPSNRPIIVLVIVGLVAGTLLFLLRRKTGRERRERIAQARAAKRRS